MKRQDPIIGQLDAFGGPPARFVKHPVHGYASRPGTGPRSETCRTCACAVVHRHNAKNYWKCSLVRPTSGPGTDIRLKSPACSQWRAKA